MRCCKTCAKPLLAHERSFCGETCRIAWQAVGDSAKSRRQKRSCRVCHKTFEAGSSNESYCSLGCLRKAKREHREALAYQRNQIPADLRFSILARDGFRCRYCGKSAQDQSVTLEVDHIVPVSRGGTDLPSNLITACNVCNSGKADLLLLTRKGQIPSYLTIESLTRWPKSRPKR